MFFMGDICYVEPLDEYLWSEKQLPYVHFTSAREALAGREGLPEEVFAHALLPGHGWIIHGPLWSVLQLWIFVIHGINVRPW